jgi:hypothetical protein
MEDSGGALLDRGAFSRIAEADSNLAKRKMDIKRKLHSAQMMFEK